MKPGSAKLKILKNAHVFIDWANVHGWQKTLREKIDIDRLFLELRAYPLVHGIHLYHGTDRHPSSVRFIERMRRRDCFVVTKLVKYIDVTEPDGQHVQMRKCDFDIEICLDVIRASDRDVESFIFLSGDGDFAPLYQELLNRGKQVIVVYTSGHIGREIWELKGGLFKVEFRQLFLPTIFLPYKVIPPRIAPWGA